VSIPSIGLMSIELTRMGIGLLILLFHRQIADYILEQERWLVVMFRQRGVPLPAVPSPETGRNIYFGIGTFVVLYQMCRIWLTLHR
jgi:hypothetical protein